MISYAIGFFSITAVGGLILATQALGKKLASWPLSIAHALLGASGLVLLIIHLLQSTGGSLVMGALALLVIAALGGFYLASLHLKKQIAPKGIVVLHAGVAVAGFLTLLSVVLGQ